MPEDPRDKNADTSDHILLYGDDKAAKITKLYTKTWEITLTLNTSTMSGGKKHRYCNLPHHDYPTNLHDCI